MERTMKALRRLSHRAVFAIAALSLVCGAVLAGEDRDRAEGEGWVAVWGASPSDTAAPMPGVTIREHVRLSLGGDQIRIRLSNRFGTSPLTVGPVHVASQHSGAAIVGATDRVVTFDGAETVTIPTGALAVSDPLNLKVADLQETAVSIFLPPGSSTLTIHSIGVATTYVSPPGDFTGETVLPVASTQPTMILLSNVEVSVRKDAGAIVTLGDSITDGFKSTVDANHRWPDILANRIRAQHGQGIITVVNEGISGNRLRKDIAGPSAQERFDRDVISQTGVRWVTLLAGISDIGAPGAVDPPTPRTTDGELITAYEQLVIRAHAAGLKIYGCTLTPFEGTRYPGFFAPDKERVREAVNQWIRNSGYFDAVIDFDKVVRDPSHPSRILPSFDSGDHLHPNDAGYRAMANAVDLGLFRGAKDDDD